MSNAENVVIWHKCFKIKIHLKIIKNPQNRDFDKEIFPKTIILGIILFLQCNNSGVFRTISIGLFLTSLLFIWYCAF